MKVAVLASVLAIVPSTFSVVPLVYCQDQRQLSIADPIELEAYGHAIGEPHPAEKAAAIEDFLTAYPETVVKNAVLNLLLAAYQQSNDTRNMLSTAKRVLDADHNNLRAAFVYVYLTKTEAIAKGASGHSPFGATSATPSHAAGKTPISTTGSASFNAAGETPMGATGPATRNAAGRPSVSVTEFTAFDAAEKTPMNAAGNIPADPSGSLPLLDDAARVARAALKVTAPTPNSGVSKEDFAKLKAATTPAFLSAIAADMAARGDWQGAIDQYIAELHFYSDPAQTTSGPTLNDTYLLGQAYLQKDSRDVPNGIFFLTRTAQYAPAYGKESIEKAAEYWYRNYHGSMDGFDAVQDLAHDNVVPPDSYKLVPAPPGQPLEKLAHDAVVNTQNPKSMALADKEFVLANGNREDAKKVWAVMKDVRTEVDGTVIGATTDSVQLANSDDAQYSHTADFIINFVARH